MNNNSATQKKDNDIDRESLEIIKEQSKTKYLEEKEELDEYEEAQQQAYDDACIEEENENPYQSEYDDRYEYVKILEDAYYLNESKASKYDQMDRFYSTYLTDVSKAYHKIIHKQCKSISDKLDREEKSKQIAALIKTDKVKTVGIFGEWGTGKSTFLEQIKKELCNEKKIKIVNLKATEYSDSEKIWTYFLTEMEKTACEKNFFRCCWHHICRFFSRLSSKLVYPVIYLIVFAIAIWQLYCLGLTGITAKLMGLKEEDIKQFTDVIVVLIGILFLFKFFNPILFQLVDLYNGRDNYFTPSKKDYAEKLGYKSVVKTNIDKILKLWKEYHFVFVVDELDRCNKNAVMSFLESIQLIDDCENVHIVYAIDEEVVLKAITDAGFNKPQNYLKKYVDKRVYLESINEMDENLAKIAEEYGLFEEEINMIQEAMKKLDVNISIREYYHILNTISELREKWINTEVKERKASKEEANKKALDWYKFIPIAIFYLEGSIWPRKIYSDFKDTVDQYNKVYAHIKNDQYAQEYTECPLYFKTMYMNDVINSVRFLKSTNPLLYVNTKE
ncbi:KAP family P-loop NTPase fold protein [Pseudobutyrivibrio sp.]|uniref:KAP family P-loop NTPase fold protein n=1 Tax=Pseudobutyrivibrio sp. TaxID=2014367 RepID=UPI0025D61740|nr:P-loop NTPase fold protein [Pseudobutyrivibrio sp.]